MMNITNEMPAFIAEYFKNGNKKKIRSIIYTAIMVVCGILMSVLEKDAAQVFTALFCVSVFAAFFGWLTYSRYPMSRRNYAWFLQYGSNQMLNSVINSYFMFNPKGLTAVGAQAIVDRSNGLVLIPYSQFAWAYVEDGRYASTKVYTKDGKQFRLIGMGAAMFTKFIQIHARALPPDVILGYGKEQQRKYNEMYKK